MDLLTWKGEICTGSHPWTKNFKQLMTAGRERVTLSQGWAPYWLQNAEGSQPWNHIYTNNKTRLFLQIFVHTHTYICIKIITKKRTSLWKRVSMGGVQGKVARWGWKEKSKGEKWCNSISVRNHIKIIRQFWRACISNPELKNLHP